MAMLSSPLAAMQPPPPRWPCSTSSDGRSLQPPVPSFNFAELGMKRTTSDYFSLKNRSIHTSSPSASLAADLSQNFYIDQSPQVATPRRCLFQSTGPGLFSNIQKQGTTTPLRWEGVTTPPIPSSSPAIAGENAMDVSPLPHKPAFSMVHKISHSEIKDLQERKRAPLQRPSFVRQRFQSTSALPRTHQLPPFTFGAGSQGSPKANTSSMSLEDCFQDSPPAPITNLFAPSGFVPVRPRSQANNGIGRNLFTNQSNSRKNEAAHRPRKQFRRTLSMFEHPADVMKPEVKSNRLDTAMDMDIDQTVQLNLPNFIPEDKPDSLPRITQQTMLDILDGQYKSLFDQTMVIDCRFEYEFKGGHIDGAVNYNDKDSLAKVLFDTPISQRTLLVLHCEYSAHRAPLMAQYIRQQDRAYNIAQYPKLTYPEVYILDGGYSSFFKNHRLRCFPQNYVEMDAKEHEQACERGLNKIRQRNKLSRAKTFAFGQRMSQIQESPSRGGMDLMIDEHTTGDLSCTHPPARRTTSY